MESRYLQIEKKSDGNYRVFGKDGMKIGDICRRRLGRFMHWCLEPCDDTYFSNGCLKDISKFITSLYSENKIQKQKKKWFEDGGKQALEEVDKVIEYLKDICWCNAHDVAWIESTIDKLKQIANADRNLETTGKYNFPDNGNLETIGKYNFPDDKTEVEE